MSTRAPHRVSREPGVLGCSIVLAAVTIALRAGGIRRAVSFARAWGGRGKPAGTLVGSDPAPELMRRTVRRVARVAAFFPGRAECLEQSLALLVLLRRRGLDAELRIGVERLPFTAHAWVEHAGRPINESAEYVGRLTPFPSLGG